jgi:hypothetical protein
MIPFFIPMQGGRILGKTLFSSLHKFPRILGWTRSSYFLMSTFFATIVLIGIVWWPMVVDYVEWYDPNYPILLQIDWLLLGIFAAMSLLIMAGADLKADFWIVLVGLVGGLVIESWGTQTNLWFYFTRERPPLWIIPAWPIASLSIDRMVRMLDGLLGDRTWLEKFFKRAYWVVFPLFLALMLYFVWPTNDKSLTVMALVLPRADPHQRSHGIAQLRSRLGIGLLPRTLGHDAPLLDLLHLPDPAAVCRAGPWHGGGGLLARG